MGVDPKDAKVFMVGAGGIGCELLKTLVMSGFEDIELVDLDTIDISNLNRQFLFHKQHVGMSKAQVARDAALAMRPTAKVVAHHGNVMAPEFDVDFFKKFSVVLNALDNLAARRHVNRLCLAAGVPLVDSGTAGYLGQATIHLKGETECYECEPKPAPKGFPTCTITNTPSKPVHCIVWAKELPFQKLFGDKSQVSDLDTAPSASDAGDHADREDAPNGASARREPQADFFAPREGENLDHFSRRIFDRLFGQNVAETLKMEDMWRTRRKPTPHYIGDILKEEGERGSRDGIATGQGAADQDGAASGKVSAAASLGLTNEHAVWSLEDNARLFLGAIKAFFEKRSKDIGSLAFDKDDALAVEFVTAAANIRAHSFGIPAQSLFAVKGIAGSIIHAVATTNAMVAGLAVLQMLRALRGQTEDPKTVWCHMHKSGTGKLLEATMCDPPNPQCHACSQTPLLLDLNTNTATLGAVVEGVIKPQIGVAYPTVTAGDSLLYEEGADLVPSEISSYAANLKRRLAEFAKPIGHGSVLTVEDYHQHFKCDIHIKHRDDISRDEHPTGMVLRGAANPLGGSNKADRSTQDGPKEKSGAGNLGTDESLVGEVMDPAEKGVAVDEEDDLLVVEVPSGKAGAVSKRGREGRDGEDLALKRQRVDVVILGDD